MFSHRKYPSQKIWNMTEHMRVMNCLKKYEKDDCTVLNKVFEYLLPLEKLPEEITIYKIVLEATNQAVEKKFAKKKPRKKEEPIDLLKFL